MLSKYEKNDFFCKKMAIYLVERNKITNFGVDCRKRRQTPLEKST